MNVQLLFFFALGIIAIYLLAKYVYLFYPVNQPSEGGKVHLYLNRLYNRELTITEIHDDCINAYDNMLSFPIHFRGRFYFVGYLEDGSEIIFLNDPRLFKWAKLAELHRRVYDVPDYKSKDQSSWK